uniref:A-kinase anchoring protein 5 n=1 Tax=Malurus cyaneus samueli TaxID=2593467 RepID=A0A8C5TWT9_9PASS
MVKAAKEIQMESPREAETPSTGATCSPPEEQAEKPSMLCFKKRKKSCKKGLTVKDACEGASEEKSQCVSTDQEEAKGSDPSQSSKGAWAAIKNLTRPRRRQKSSSRKKVPSESQVQLEVDAEESCAQDIPKKRASSGVKMPCVRFSRGKKKPSPSEDKPESFSPVSAEEKQDTVKGDQDTVKEGDTSVGKSEPLTEPTPDAEEHSECTVQTEITDSETVGETAQDKLQERSLPQTTDHVDGREGPPEEPVSNDQHDDTPEITLWQEIPNTCEETPERDELEESVNLPEESKAEETDFSELESGGDATRVQDAVSVKDAKSVQEAANVQDAASVKDAVSQKGNKKSNRSADVGTKEGPEAGGGPQAEEKGLGDQGHRTGEQYELLLVETASSLVKAAIQSSIEQLVNEMALEQNKHNSFL